MASTKPSLILGTAGHIDHGKSSLVQALTGTDPDRLEEEKRRGITIQLGFAQLRLPSGKSLGVVDVPGHERFVRQMVAGATGVDVALLVIAADDGVMPQTVEHLAVLRVLGIRRLVVAMTKIDLVDPDWIEFMQGEIEDYLANTPFASCPVVPCSSRTREGLDALLAALDTAVQGAERVHEQGGMRMPVDRAFTVKGFGTVVTGTLWGGSVAPGDELEVLPRGIKSRVRSVQVHGADRDRAGAGNRVAVCLADVDLADVHPGDFLAAPGSVQVSNRFDARMEYLDPFCTEKPLESGMRVRVAHGTREVEGRVLSLEGAGAFKPGSSCLVQFRLDEELPLCFRDRFIVRTLSPARVVGGGGVLNAHPRRRSTLNESEQGVVDALDRDDVAGAVTGCVRKAPHPMRLADAAAAAGLPETLVKPHFEALRAEKDMVSLGSASDPYICTKALLQRMGAAIEKELLAFHGKNPDALGVSKEALRATSCPQVDQACFDQVIAGVQQAVVANGLVAHKTAGAGAQLRAQAACDALLAVYEAAGTWPATADDAISQAGLDKNAGRKGLGDLEREGKIVRYAPDGYMEAGALARMRGAVVAWLEAHGSATAAELKEAMGTSRKYAMPLLELFDAEGITKRNGDLRSLCPKR